MSYKRLCRFLPLVLTMVVTPESAFDRSIYHLGLHCTLLVDRELTEITKVQNCTHQLSSVFSFGFYLSVVCIYDLIAFSPIKLT